MRSEDDLRAAFAAKAADAPRTEDVLRAVARAERSARARRRRPWIRWLVPAVTVAAAAAIAVPIVLRGRSDDVKAGSGSVAATQSRAEAAGGASSAAAQAPAGTAALAVCRPDQVRARLLVDGSEATLTLTAGSASCAVARVPVLRWPAPLAQAPAAPRSSATRPDTERPQPSYGILREGRTATAAIGADRPCFAPTGSAVQVDWGAGPVSVPVTGQSRRGCTASSTIPPQAGAFTGLS